MQATHPTGAQRLANGIGLFATRLLADLPLLGEGHLLSAVEVAAILGVDRRRVYQLREAGLLRGCKIGRSLRFAPSDVLALLETADDVETPPW